jgi:succinyl-CoA synthetase beta subunit
MSAQQYAEAVIATALHNGMTIEQISKMAPTELAQAHLQTQNKATEAAAKQILAEMK